MDTKKKAFAKLGYTHMDTAEIVTLLNRLLSNMMIYVQKIRKFHWEVIGQDYFELTRQFETMFKNFYLYPDKIAQRIRLLDQLPKSTFNEYLTLSTIKEDNKTFTPFEMVKLAMDDTIDIIDLMELTIYAAQEMNDNGTEHLLKLFIYNIEIEYNKLSLWMKK